MLLGTKYPSLEKYTEDKFYRNKMVNGYNLDFEILGKTPLSEMRSSLFNCFTVFFLLFFHFPFHNFRHKYYIGACTENYRNFVRRKLGQKTGICPYIKSNEKVYEPCSDQQIDFFFCESFRGIST